MNTFEFPEEEDWKKILARPTFDKKSLEDKIGAVLAEIKENGDAAITKYTALFDKVELSDFVVSESEIVEAESILTPELKKSIQQAAANIQAFHIKQMTKSEVISTMPGIECWRKSVGIEKVGLYIPGGSAPLFSTILMLAIPAKIAGCKEIVLCTPPDKEGKLNPAILFAANLVGVTKIFKIGGVQAIGAMAYGTETVPQVYKVFGPGNQFVMGAKLLIQKEGVAIDMPAGPSEVCVMADDSAQPAFVAADLLSQAEHGPDSQVVLVTSSKDLLDEVAVEIDKQLAVLPRKEIAAKALENSKLILVKDIDTAIKLSNIYAPEHLILSVHNVDIVAQKIVNAGSVFLGNYSPESVGDYASGTNHTLPTNGYAKAYSGVSVDSFVKKITFQKLDASGLRNIASTVVNMAEAEGLQAHANAVIVRKQFLDNSSEI